MTTLEMQQLKNLEPKKNELWFVKLPDENWLRRVTIYVITHKIVIVDYRSDYSNERYQVAYKLNDVEFVEKVEDVQ